MTNIITLQIKFKQMKHIISIFIFTLLSLAGISQKTVFTCTAPKVVTLGEQFNVTYNINDVGSYFRGPSFKNFVNLGGPSQSSRSGSTYSNGKSVYTKSTSYSYLLRAKQAGKFKIPAASVKANGKTYTSNTSIIEVVKGKKAANNQNTQGISDDDLFVKVLLSKNEVYKGESVIATVKVFTRSQNIKFLDIKLPSFDGFLTQEIEDKPNTLYRENYNGQVYYVGIFKKLVLFPQRSGTITIDPFELKCRVSIQSGYRRNVFGQRTRAYKNLEVDVKSPTRKLKVKELPTKAPASFEGAIGNFKMQPSINKTNSKTNEAINLKVKISGNGNLKLIDPLDIKFPADFEVYEPKIKNNFKATNNGVAGSKTFDFLMIPRHAGSFTIPPFSFTYFDIKAKKYKTINSDGYKLTIEKGDDDNTTTVVSGFSKEDVKFIGKDIRYIKTNISDLKKKDDFIFKSFMFWITYAASFLIFLIILIVRKKNIRDNSNVMLMKNKRANKEATKRLKAAQLFLKANDKNKFYEEILRAINGYLSDKLNIPVADLTKENAFEKLQQYSIQTNDIESIGRLLDTCEFAQYSPTDSTSQMSDVYEEAKSYIGKLENLIR